MKETEKAYLAGLFDGEGSVHLAGSYIPRLKRRHIMVGAKIAMQSFESVERFAKAVNANVGRHGAVYECCIWQRKAVNFLSEIYPYLSCKRGRALFAMWAYEAMFGGRGKGANKLSKKELQLREVCAKIMKLLNVRESLIFHGKVGEFDEQLSPLIIELVDMLTPSQVPKGKGFGEGQTTTKVSPNNKPSHERPPLYH